MISVNRLRDYFVEIKEALSFLLMLVVVPLVLLTAVVILLSK